MKRSITLMVGLLLAGTIVLSAQKSNDVNQKPIDFGFEQNVDDGEPPVQLGTNVWQQTLAQAISIYPNPGAGEFTIALNTAAQVSEIAIYDLTGRIVQKQEGKSLLTSNQYKIDITAHHPGMYLVVLRNGSDTYVHRIIKN